MQRYFHDEHLKPLYMEYNFFNRAGNCLDKMDNLVLFYFLSLLMFQKVLEKHFRSQNTSALAWELKSFGSNEAC